MHLPEKIDTFRHSICIWGSSWQKMSGINLRYAKAFGSKSLDDAPKVSKCPSNSAPAENAKWTKNNESEIQSNKTAPASFHHLSLIPFWNTVVWKHIGTLNSCWLLVNVPHSIWLAPQPHKNVAKFHLLHPSPGSSTGPMCLKLHRCRARSQPVRDSCGCWVISMNSVVKKPTLIPQPKQLQH